MRDIAHSGIGEDRMTRKEMIFNILKDAELYESEYFAVAIETEGNEGQEVIVNPSCNLSSG